ncbi:MAG: hypothetical protein ACRD1T_01760 [Acidimicrobiia bacterium]
MVWGVEEKTNQFSRLEEALLQIPGIRAARVVSNGGVPDEIHIVSAGGKGPKQIVRDVQTVALATLGLQVDHRIVSVVQFPEDQISIRAPRIVIDEIATRTLGTTSTVEVVLSQGDTSSKGEASGMPSVEGLQRLAAEATLQAVRGLTSNGAWPTLEHVAVQRSGVHDVVVVTVSYGSGATVLSGSAIVTGQIVEAAVRAVLDSLNRKLTK